MRANSPEAQVAYVSWTDEHFLPLHQRADEAPAPESGSQRFGYRSTSCGRRSAGGTSKVMCPSSSRSVMG